MTAGDRPDTGAAQCECVSRMDTSKCPVHGGDNRGWGRQSDYVLDGSPDAVAIVREARRGQPDTGAVERAAEVLHRGAHQGIWCAGCWALDKAREHADALAAAGLLAQPADAEAVGLRARLAALVAEDVFNPRLRTAGELPESVWVIQADDLRAVLADTEDRPGGGTGGRATPDSFGRTKPIYEGEA